jgi:2-amino-4-hydroxy-6-hydroxymethyldihydropteridine diphosphokinase
MESESGRPPRGEETWLDAVVGLGSNLGDPWLTLRRAVLELGTLSPNLRISAIYRSVPVGGPPQPDFLNAAVRLRYPGPAVSLLRDLLALERAAGRERRERWGPRSLDLDILWVSGLELEQPGLCIPHPRLRERAFALRPLLDVAPDAVDPRDGVRYATILDELGMSGIQPLAAAWFEPPLVDPPLGMDSPGPGW